MFSVYVYVRVSVPLCLPGEERTACWEPFSPFTSNDVTKSDSKCSYPRSHLVGSPFFSWWLINHCCFQQIRHSLETNHKKWPWRLTVWIPILACCGWSGATVYSNVKCLLPKILNCFISKFSRVQNVNLASQIIPDWLIKLPAANTGQKWPAEPRFMGLGVAEGPGGREKEERAAGSHGLAWIEAHGGEQLLWGLAWWRKAAQTENMCTDLGEFCLGSRQDSLEGYLFTWQQVKE